MACNREAIQKSSRLKQQMQNAQSVVNVFFIFLVVSQHLQDIPPKKLLSKQQVNFKHPSFFSEGQ